jgi:hypothetical protein
MVYGQQYDWFDDSRILYSAVGAAVLLAIFMIRQLSSKRPYFHIQVFKYRKFVLAALLLFVFYICRGSFGVTTSFMSSAMGMDPIHVGYLLIYNLAAIIISVTISSRFLLKKTPLRQILILGFTLLLAFHVYMCFVFSTQVNTEDLIIPVMLQGLGAGMLMTPVILFVISSSPAKYGTTGSAVGIFMRFAGFSSSIALINYFQLYRQNDHTNRFQEQLSQLNPLAVQKLVMYKQALTGKGVAADQAAKIANGLLSKNINTQAQLRFAVDYYQLISWVLLAIILLVILFPSVNRTIINLKSDQPAAVVY